ncbi:hypothetical protein GGF46_002896 [Coemansia sp. RSA 552]|nr:hypothetical protein GGF46_002896 [Coemansia sp. RSA 552]
MSASFTIARLVELLRGQTMLLGDLGRRARRALRLGALPFAYANAAEIHSPGDREPPVLNKARVNEQIPLKPVYIAPRNPVVLCHGLYGFDVKGPENLPILQVHYWRGIREALEGVGAKVVVAKVPGTGGIRERAQQLDSLLESRLESSKVNILGHSMGGLDARYLITHINPKRYSVASLTTVCTPHRGSPFMDWCRDYLNLGYRVDPDQLIRDFATVWRSSNAGAKSPMGDTLGTASASHLPDALLRQRINSIIRHAVGESGAPLPVVSPDHAGAAEEPVLLGLDIDPADVRLQEFARFLTRLLSENASVGESSELSSLARKSAGEGDYLGRSMVLLRMVYRRIMSTLDTPAYACLTTDYCQRFFNPSTPNVPGVEYLSIGAHMDPTGISEKVNPLIIPHDIIHKAEGPNDGFVSLRSARWGHYLGSVCADHFDFTNRRRVTSLGRDFIGTVTYWSGKWSSWLNRDDKGDLSAESPPPPALPNGLLPEYPLSGTSTGQSRTRFDPIDFYLRIGTILYQRGL